MRYFTICLLAAGLLNSASAQDKTPFKDRLVPYMGYTLSFVNFGDSLQLPFNIYSFNTLGAGSYISLGHVKDVLSIGLNTGAHLGINFSRTGRTNWLVRTPLMLMGRVGSMATRYNTQGIGLGVGIGAVYTYMRVNSIGTWVERMHAVNPAAVAEINLNTRRTGKFSVQAMLSLANSRAYASSKNTGGDPIPYDKSATGQFSLGLVYGF